MKHEIDFSKIVFPLSLNVTEQEIDISLLTPEQKQTYTDLLKEIVDWYQMKQKPRVIIGMAGPAGAGKSVTVAILKELAKQLSLPFRFEAVGIDAFHYTNEHLLSHFSDGEPLKNHKGRFNTYDVEKLTRSLRSFVDDEKVSFPIYSRKIHDPIENAVIIKKDEPTLLLVEGLWVLYEKEGWGEVGNLLDFSIFMDIDNEKVKQGVLERHIRGGRTPEDAAVYYEKNEAKSLKLIMQTKDKADKIVSTHH